MAITATVNATQVTPRDSPLVQNRFHYPILVKNNKSATLLPGEGFHIPIVVKGDNTIVEIEPRKEAPRGFISNHLQMVEDGAIYVYNMSAEPIKIKKHTPVCQVKETVDTTITLQKSNGTAGSMDSADPPTRGECCRSTPTQDLSKINIDPGKQLTEKQCQRARSILEEYDDIFTPDLPGYNHHYGKVEASFQWASPARPPVNRARMPDYNSRGNAIFNEKAKELLQLGVFKKASDLDVQPSLKNNSFLVKKQAATSKSWDACTTKDVRMVTSFAQLQKFILTIPAKVTRHDKILQACANWKFMAELDLSNMFFQIPMKRSSIGDLKKLSYMCTQTDEGTLVYVRAPQGLPGISEYEEELTDSVFGDMVIQGKVVKYADNIYVGGSDPANFLDNFEGVCERLSKSNLRVNPSKVIVAIVDTTIMGWHWHKGTLTPSVHKLNPLTVCDKPQTITGLRSFLGGMRFHKRCLPGVDNVSQPLDEACPSTTAGKDKIVWTEAMNTSFQQCQEIMKHPKAVVVPRKDDQLVQVGDAALHLPAIGTVLVAIREGVEGCLPVGYFGFRVKGSMQNWTPCELEAYTHAVAMEENSIYFRESSKPPICLSDNSSVVDAAKKISNGRFSASPRLQTLVTAVQRYNATFKHISGKLPTALIAVADFCSRNPVECSTPSCKICQLSRDPDTSFSTIRLSQLHSSLDPKSSRPAWKQIQESSNDLRRAAAHITSGTRPSKKDTKIKDIKKLVSKGTMSKDGLLVVKHHLPMDVQPVEQIVVPREFSLSVMTLLHNDPSLNHPSIHQMLELIKRKFYFFNQKNLAQTVYDNCLQCASRKKISPAIVSLETQTKPSKPGEFCNADVLVRNKQKILVVRDNLTSFTQTKFVNSEQKADLRSGLASLICPIKPNTPTQVRVDPHSTFKALKNDQTLHDMNIFLEVGHEKNKNKNSVAEKAIQELEEEFLKLLPTNSDLDELTLIKATASLNSRIRHTGRSAKELLTKRDQFSGEDINVLDGDLSDKQYARRQRDNKAKMLPSCLKTPTYQRGDIVFIRSDKDKNKNRDSYIIVSVQTDSVEVVKATSRARGSKYLVKNENIYKALPSVPSADTPVSSSDNESSDNDDEQFCFYCKGARYLDYHHHKSSCSRYRAVAKRQPPAPQRTTFESDSDDDLQETVTRPDISEEEFLDAVQDPEGANDENDDNEEAEEVNEVEDEDDREVEANDAEQDLHDENPMNAEYDKPKKNDRIEYLNDDQWRKASILSSIRGYGGGWFNVKHDDNSEGSVQLTENNIWRFEDPNRRGYFTRRWGHLSDEPGGSNNGDDTEGDDDDNTAREGV
jgi:hypothetical protein